MRWVVELRRDVGFALLDQELFWELQALAKNHPGSISPSELFDWMCWNHIQLMALRIRRLVDHDRRTLSVVRLLREVYEHPSAINRTYHSSLYRRTPMGTEYGAECFDREAGTKSGRLSLKVIRTEIRGVERLSRSIKHVVDKRIAHRDLKFSPRKLPTIRHIDEALAEMDRVVCRYHFLLTGDSMGTCKPTRQNDWCPKILQKL